MPNDTLFCKLYVDGAGQREDLIKLIALQVDGATDGVAVTTPWAIIDVVNNDDYDRSRIVDNKRRFLFFPFLVELEIRDNVRRPEYIANVRGLISGIVGKGFTVVPSCDFESELMTEKP